MGHQRQNFHGESDTTPLTSCCVVNYRHQTQLCVNHKSWRCRQGDDGAWGYGVDDDGIRGS